MEKKENDGRPDVNAGIPPANEGVEIADGAETPAGVDIDTVRFSNECR